MKKQKKRKIEKRKNETETKEKLEELLSSYSASFQYSSSRVERLNELLSRNSSKKWSKKKKEKMLRRHSIAEEETSFSSNVVDQVEFRMSQIVEEKNQ